jgi:branched-chain amino acid transport system substrate-binding protein
MARRFAALARRSAVVTTIAVIAATLTLAGCTGTPGGGTGAAKEPYRIGAVLSLTGTYAGLGVPERNAIELEVARANAAGGIDGHPIEILFEDDATDPAKAQAATTRLIEQEKVVAIIGATGTGQTMGMRGDIDRAGIPQVSLAGGNAVTAQFDPLVFQTPWPNRIVVPFTLSYLKSNGITKVALLSDSGGYGKDGRQVVLDGVGGAGVTIVADETFNPGDTDMSAQLTKIKAAKPQAIWMWAAGKEGAIIAKNLKQIDAAGTMRLIGTPGNGRKEFAEGAGDAGEGFTFPAGRILLPESYGKDAAAYEVAIGFIERYTAKYDKAPDIFAGHAYDAITIVVDALKRADAESGAGTSGGTGSVKLRDAIERTKGLVGVGGTFTYSATDHNGLTEKDLVMYRIEGGAWNLAE